MKNSFLLIALLGTLASPAMATTFTAEYIAAGSASSFLPNANPRVSGPTLAPGLHVQVLSGEVMVKNQGGIQYFTAGQFGFTPTMNTPPSLVAPNAGITFSPPPAFNASQGATAGSQAKPNEVTCVVR